MPEQSLSAWERRTEWPLTALAVVFLGTYAWQVLDTGATRGLYLTLDVALLVIWAVFAIDYATRFVLADAKLKFVRRSLFDLLAVAVPMFRQLRILRIIGAVSVLQRRAEDSLRGRVSLYVGGVTVLVVLSTSLAVLDAERASPDAKIVDFGGALWWTITTITTVGYGDLYPVTGTGKVVAATLMLAGIALLGVITGSIASWFVERIKATEQAVEQAAKDELVALRQEIAALRAEVRATSVRHPSPRPMPRVARRDRPRRRRRC